jgi:transaldolase
MKIFLDSVNIKEITELINTGFIDGITTNPSLLAKQFDIDVSSKVEIYKKLSDFCKNIDLPISFQVTSTDYKSMLNEAKELSELSEFVVVKLPLTYDGLRVCESLTNLKIKTNVTLCFSEAQAIMAAKAGATYVSCFIGRLDDVGYNGLKLIKNVKKIYDNFSISTKILSASIRNIKHITEAFLYGSDIVTISTKLFKQMFEHSLTDKGIKQFLDDWNKNK